MCVFCVSFFWLLFCFVFSWTYCVLHKKYRAGYETLLGYGGHVLMCCPYFFPVACLSAKMAISLIYSRKGKVLILEWDIYEKRLNCKQHPPIKTQNKTKNPTRTETPLTTRPSYQVDCIIPAKWTFWLPIHKRFLSEVKRVCKWAAQRFLMQKWWGQEGWDMTINNSFNVGFQGFCSVLPKHKC